MARRLQKIHFHYPSGRFYFPGRQHLKRFILQLIKKEKHQVHDIAYIFCSDTYLLRINQEFLRHSTFTDIITFPFSPPGEPISAEIYISIDRVKENAHLYNVLFLNELHRVILHGALHLCGYKDKSRQEKQLMRNKEDNYLKRLHVSRGTPPKV